MKTFVLILSAVFISLTHLCAGDPPPPPAQIAVSQSGIVEINGVIRIGVFKPFADKINEQLANDSATPLSKVLKLYLNGVPMEGLAPVALPAEAFDAAANAKPDLVLQYALSRDPNNPQNVDAWNTLLPRLKFGENDIQVGLGLNNGIPKLTLGNDLHFQVRSKAIITSVVIGELLLFVLLMWWAISTPMLREAGPGTAYSLGKAQMAFWGLFVALGFLGVWIVEHDMEPIPSQILTLLGISGATGLGSMLIGNGKKSAADGEAQNLTAKRAKIVNDQATALQHLASLQKEKTLGGDQWTPAKEKTLADAQQQSTDLEAKLKETDDAISQHGDQAKPNPSSGNWFVDIISDANGYSFHRFQLVLWTIILGFVFAWTISNTSSMPVFDNSLLILMGISNGTYLGFKYPEQQG